MSLNVKFTNLELQPIGQININEKPAFETYAEDLEALTQALKPFQSYTNILLVANGGSVWSFMSYYTALADRHRGKNIVLLTDMEPDYLNQIKQSYKPANSLVIVISKSGSTVGTLENLFALAEYPQLLVTDLDSPLSQIGAKLGTPVIKHPPVGGRFSGLTSCAFAPAILCGLDVKSIDQGARSAYEQYRDPQKTDNKALQVAQALWQLEQNGYSDIFMPIYSNYLQIFGQQVTQLFHESFGKDGKGLTVLAVQAPESQHHTNQRYFGGPKNMIGLFVRSLTQKTELTIKVPDELQNIELRQGLLGNLNNLNLSQSFNSEYIGTLTDAKNQGMPIIEITLDEISPFSVGEFMGFWHYVTVFSAILRGVDPYDQPQVENSKVISFAERLKK